MKTKIEQAFDETIAAAIEDKYDNTTLAQRISISA